MYEVRFSRPAERTFEGFAMDVRVRLDVAVAALGRTPRPPGAIKLAGSDLWRIRVDDYRVIYEVRDQVLVILVVRIAHRREAYR